MITDPASLERLHDIVVPPPMPWWPPAPGWLWLLGFAATAGFVLLLRGFIRWQRNRYRREALAELSQLEADARDPAKRAAAVAGVSALLKRTALTAYGRATVASLTGPAWFEFLDRCGSTHFGDGLGQALEAAVYRPGAAGATPVAMAGLAAEARHWIRDHGPLPEAAVSQARPVNDPAATAPAERNAA